MMPEMKDDPRRVTLAGVDYPIAPLTIGQMRYSVPASTRAAIDTPDGMAAILTVIFQGMKAGGYAGKIEDLDAMSGVTIPELITAHAKTVRLFNGLERKPDGASETRPGPGQSGPSQSGEAQPGA